MLEDARTAERPAITPSPESPVITAEDIDKKLQEVEDRRRSLEAATLERLAEAEKRAEEVRDLKSILSMCLSVSPSSGIS